MRTSSPSSTKIDIHVAMLGKCLTAPVNCLIIELLPTKFMISRKIGRPSSKLDPFITPNKPFSTGEPLYRITESSGTHSQTPLLTSSSAIPSISPFSAWTIPSSRGKGLPSSGNKDNWGLSNKCFECSETQSIALIDPPWPTGGNADKICANVNLWQVPTSSPL